MSGNDDSNDLISAAVAAGVLGPDDRTDFFAVASDSSTDLNVVPLLTSASSNPFEYDIKPDASFVFNSEIEEPSEPAILDGPLSEEGYFQLAEFFQNIPKP